MLGYGVRRGFSLIELLVVIGILALLIALLLPALQESRSVARKVDCQSRLRQMGLALLLYHDTENMFPLSTSLPPLVTADDDYYGEHKMFLRDYACYGWATRLLPYFEQTALFNELDIGNRTLEELIHDRPDLHPLVERRLEVFRCPVDLQDDTTISVPLPGTRAALDDGVEVYGGSSSYVGNCGLYDQIWPRGLHPIDRSNGLFFNGSCTRLTDITDGASQTIAVGERAWFQGGATWVGSPDLHGEWGKGSQFIFGNVFYRINAIPDPPGVLITPRDSLTITGRWSSRNGFSSYHPGGAYFLFADGSVQFLNENIESRVTIEPCSRAVH